MKDINTYELISELSDRIATDWESRWVGSAKPSHDDIKANVTAIMAGLKSSQASMVISAFGGAAQTPMIAGPGVDGSIPIMFDALPQLMTALCKVMGTQKTVAIVECGNCGTKIEQHFDTVDEAKGALVTKTLCPNCVSAGNNVH